jgi:hypothetical protein
MVDPLTIVSSFFQIPSSWLQFPEILTMVIVPFVVLIWFFKLFLYEKLRIFKNEAICWALGALLSFLVTFVSRFGMILAPIGLIGIVWFKVNNMVLRIVLIIALILVLFSLSAITQNISNLFK